MDYLVFDFVCLFCVVGGEGVVEGECYVLFEVVMLYGGLLFG